jgi:hypothetical protein
MHMITPPLKSRMASELKPLLEDWYGNGTLKMTSIYGVRKYTVSPEPEPVAVAVLSVEC